MLLGICTLNGAGDQVNRTLKPGLIAGKKLVTLLTKFSKTSMSMLRELAPQVLLVAAVFGAGYYYGSRGEREVKVINKVVEKVVLETVYEDRIKYVDRVKTIEKLVPQVIEREVYKNVCMDDDGVKIFNAYIGVKE